MKTYLLTLVLLIVFSGGSHANDVQIASEHGILTYAQTVSVSQILKADKADWYDRWGRWHSKHRKRVVIIR